MKKKIIQWLHTDYVFLPEKVVKKYYKTGVAKAAGYMFPRASQHQLLAACKFFMWAFVIDDKYERGPVDRLKHIHQKAIAILRYQGTDNGDEELTPVTDFREQLVKCANHEWLERFTNSLDLYFDGITREIPYRVHLKFPTFTEFYEIRERAVNVFPLVNICEMITGEVLPYQIVEHQQIKRLSQLTCRILAYANDYFSAKLEHGNDVWNLVLMIQQKYGYGQKKAYRKAVAIHDKDLAEFCRIWEDLPDFGNHNKAVHLMIENFARMISGYLHWTLTATRRYSGGGHPAGDLQYA